jgi:protein-tyrosine phosphatase
MAEQEYKFPDEIDNEDLNIEIEIEDDTPPEDRNREPMPKEIVEKLEKTDP